jgi:23S rRNA pseudouridine2605 synthase
MRLQKLLASAGFGSRRGCEQFIEEGRVEINGEIAQLGDRADLAVDRVTFDGERIQSERPSYWLLHKPLDVVTSVIDPHGRDTVMHLLPKHVGRVYPVGRLDRDSSGLLLMTNDGALTQLLLHPSHESEKEYRVTVKGQVEAETFERLRKGLHLEDGRTAPAKVGTNRYDPDNDMTTFLFTLIEGRKRQIRRMLLAVGHPVKRLVRVRMGPLALGRLGAGQCRELRGEEISALKSYAEKLKPSRRSRATGRRRTAEDRA